MSQIRCSGFEATDDGRCSNCMRFNQDCIFTPVSAQTQAFVPAHTVWRGVGAPPPLYGAYGQPLPPANPGNAYAQPPHQQQYLPSAAAATGPYQAHSAYSPQPGAPYPEGSRDAHSRKRPSSEPQPPALPPPNPALSSQLPGKSAAPEYAFAESPLTSAVSPAPAPSPAYPPAAPASTSQPYYGAQPPRRASPHSPYSYGSSGTSSSPNTQATPSTPGAPPYFGAPQPNGAALQPIPPRSDGRTPPPPASQTSSRPGMRINDLVTDNGHGRSTTDADMLNMLNRRPV